MLRQTIGGILIDSHPILVVAESAWEACELLLIDEYDLILLDLDLLQESANSVLQDCPSSTFTLALGSPASKEKILDAIKSGASDFALQPLDAALFRLRIGMALANSVAVQENWIKFGCLTFDVTNSSVLLAGEQLALTPTERRLLLALMRRGGSLVNKQFLSRAISIETDWSSNSAVEVYIHRLRRKLESSDVQIRTVRGLGYALHLSSKKA